MFNIHDYDRFILLCGGSFDRKGLLEASKSLDKDVDFKRILRFKHHYLYKRRERMVLLISSAISFTYTIYSYLSTIAAGLFHWNQPSIPLILLTGLSAYLMINDIFLLFAKDKASSFIATAAKELTGETENRKGSAKRFLLELKRRDPQTPKPWWYPVEGHVSDVQPVLYLNSKLKGSGKPECGIMYTGKPYYTEFFADSLYIRLRNSAEDSDSKKNRYHKVLDRIWDENDTIHIIKYFKSREMDQQDHRLNHSTYVYGIGYFSRFLQKVADRFHKNVADKRKIAFFFEGQLKDSGIRQSAAKLLIQASSSPEYVCIEPTDGWENHLLEFDVVYLSRMGESPEEHKIVKEMCKSGDVFRLPVKRPFFVPNPTNNILFRSSPTGAGGEGGKPRTLVLGMGGIEQNHALLQFVAEHFWQTDRGERKYGINENLFSDALINMGSENLVHSVFTRVKQGEHHTYISPHITSVSKMKAHTYFLRNIGNPLQGDRIDLMGIYGYSAISTKICAMFLIKTMFSGGPDPSLERIQLAYDTQAPTLLEINPLHRPGNESSGADPFKEWDVEDIINHHDKFERFSSKYTMGWS